ncbi:MAG: hypothetical protein SFU56_22030 [Capsulimonadales bacterium]|nr:hypothetical protein [Capsulimonadales bacterium]
MTTWMLLDELRQCQEHLDALLQHIKATRCGEEKRLGIVFNPVLESVESAHFHVSHILRLLWRDGLWTDAPVTERSDSRHRAFHVLEQPFTDGKPHGRPLPESASADLCDLLGLCPLSDETEVTALIEALRFFRHRQPIPEKAG